MTGVYLNRLIASGDVKSSLWKMAIEIVDLPINSMVIFHSYVSLPEGSQSNSYLDDATWRSAFNLGYWIKT